ncbi:MAG TPA: helix-turn-helix domain-containing protein [Bryobacteraceae bacterium]|nr:helix-turn-helix domain-containing protein [Bryobacteraceae bacterium]
MQSFLNELEVAKRLNVSVPTLRRWRLEKRGPMFVNVGSLVRYRPEDLDSWVAALPTGGDSNGVAVAAMTSRALV